jgi:mycothiol synthase
MLGRVSLTTRPLRYVDGVIHPDDLAEATRVILACEASVVDTPDTTADDVVHLLTVSSTDRDRSVLLVDDAGDVTGLLRVEKDPFEQVTQLDVVTLPWPQSRGLRAEALALGLQGAREHRDAAGSPTWKARAGMYVQDTVFGEVLTEAGMVPVRRFYQMSIDASSPEIPAEAPPLPAGVEIVARDDDETRRAIYDLDRVAFSEHWGWADYPYDAWIEHMTASPSYDPSDWWLLTVGGAPAAICLLSNSRAELGEGYVGVLAVLKDFRGRGLAQLLLRCAFVHYRDLGRTAIALGVDATNTTGAVALYEKVGMRPALVFELYEHDLT